MSAQRHRPRSVTGCGLLLILLAIATPSVAAEASVRMARIRAFNFQNLRLAVEDAYREYGDPYTAGVDVLSELDVLERRAETALAAAAAGEAWAPKSLTKLVRSLESLKRRALLGHPAVQGLQVLCVKRAWNDRTLPSNLKPMGINSNHECPTSLSPVGYDNEIALFDAGDPTGTWKTLYRPDDTGWVGDLDLDWDGQRILFCQADEEQWRLWEMRIDGSHRRQLSKEPVGVDCFDACYLSNGQILCGANATAQGVPCWHGTPRKEVANLFVMNSDGSEMHRVTFDQDHDMNPAVLDDGRVVYNRWDYTGVNRVFARPLMVMNPDGTGQRAIYGSNSWFPNGLYAPRALPGESGRLLCILSGYHGPGQTGHLVIVDTNQGTRETAGIVQRLSGQGLPLEVKYMDQLTTDTWPKFRTSYPITAKQYLVTAWMRKDAKRMGVYLADAFDNLLLLHEIDRAALLDPIPVKSRPRPPEIPSRIEPGRKDATVYLQDVYIGPGLKGVPRGTIKQIRVIAYHFGYEHLAGNDKIGLTGPWDAMRIVGTTPVEDDGSALFRIPANTPVAFQTLDAEGKAVQLMRSWFSARPGERVSCIGCHEDTPTTPILKRTVAAQQVPRELDSWYGPPRGFDFAREVQPVLNRHCVTCHDGRAECCDLRPEDEVADYRGRVPGRLDTARMHEHHRALDEGRIRYTPAYEALLPYVRRVNVGDTVELLTPGHYHADTSELIQMLKKGHQGVRLDPEAWDRLVTWIDLNAPCHGTWGDVFSIPIPGDSGQCRIDYFARYGGPPNDPEAVVESQPYDPTPTPPRDLSQPHDLQLQNWPLDPSTVRAGATRTMELGNEIKLGLVRVPAGRFVMGDVDGQLDEQPLAVVSIDKPFWIGTCEVTNEQFAQFSSTHNSGLYWKRHAERTDDRGMSLAEPKQPVLNVSWHEAMAFCRWLSKVSDADVALPTEAQWEFACRAGSDTAMSYGSLDDDFGPFANMADKTFATFGCTGKSKTGKFETEPGIDTLVAEGVDLADRRFDDGDCVTAPVGQRRSNGWAVHDMHGNVAEWTRSAYRPYPYDPSDGRDEVDALGEKVVRGGSYLDRPARCTSSVRYAYPAWQKVHNVGFRVVVRDGDRPRSPSTDEKIPSDSATETIMAEDHTSDRWPLPCSWRPTVDDLLFSPPTRGRRPCPEFTRLVWQINRHQFIRRNANQ